MKAHVVKITPSLYDRWRVFVAADRRRYLVAALAGMLLVIAVALAAGFTKLVPTLVDPQVPWAAAKPFVAGALALSSEVAALVGWPLGWVEAALRSRERGEARARMAIGESPWARIVSLTPVAWFLFLIALYTSASWGADAQGPGRVARALVERARESCLSVREAKIVAVPLVKVTWLCRPGRPPVVVGEGPNGSLDYAASAFSIDDGLTAVTLRDAQILLPSTPPVQGTFSDVQVKGLKPQASSSPIRPFHRALAVGTSALLIAVLAAVAAWTGTFTERTSAWVIVALASGSTLAILRQCELRAFLGWKLVLVPGGGILVFLFSMFLWRFVLMLTHLLKTLRRRYHSKR